MKKYLIIVLSVLCVLGLVGCNNKSLNYIIPKKSLEEIEGRELVDERTFEKHFTYYKHYFVNTMHGADEQSENRDFQYEI